MKKITKKECKTIYDNLKKGLVYSDGFRGFYLYDNFIRWNNYGSSAEKFTLDNIYFIVNVIFDRDISNLKIDYNLFVYA